MISMLAMVVITTLALCIFNVSANFHSTVISYMFSGSCTGSSCAAEHRSTLMCCWTTACNNTTSSGETPTRAQQWPRRLLQAQAFYTIFDMPCASVARGDL